MYRLSPEQAPYSLGKCLPLDDEPHGVRRRTQAVQRIFPGLPVIGCAFAFLQICRQCAVVQVHFNVFKIDFSGILFRYQREGHGIEGSELRRAVLQNRLRSAVVLNRHVHVYSFSKLRRYKNLCL